MQWSAFQSIKSLYHIILYRIIIYFNFSDNQLFDITLSLRNENLQLTIQNEKLRQENQSTSVYGGGVDFTKISALEHKILSQQEELTELHKRRGENAQLLIDLNNKLQDKDKHIETTELR